MRSRWLSVVSEASRPAAAQPLLFLIADTGGGHRASANAVARELADTFPGRFTISIVDPFAQAAPRVVGGITSLYGPIAQHGRWLWGGLYHLTDTRTAVSLLVHSLLRPVQSGVGNVVAALQPGAVVSFHPLLNHVAVAATARVPSRVPVVTVITDLVDVHAAWACRDVDAVVVPSPGALDRCRRAGIVGGRCFELGLPVDPAFSAPRPQGEDLRRLRRRLGLAPDRFTVLLCGGADGSGGIDRRARAIAEAGMDVQVAAVCGRNRHAFDRLRGLEDSQGVPISVQGFVTNMAEWMQAADIVVTKAGPGTIAEALCCGAPLLLSWFLPGQERGNVEWVTDTGAGRYVPGIAELIDAVRELSVPNSAALAAMRAVVRRVARPDATARIAALIAGCAAQTR